MCFLILDHSPCASVLLMTRVTCRSKSRPNFGHLIPERGRGYHIIITKQRALRSPAARQLRPIENTLMKSWDRAACGSA